MTIRTPLALRPLILLVASIALSSAAMAQVKRLMPLGDSITNGSEGGYRTVLFNRLNEGGETIDFVGSLRWANDRPLLADSDHEGHGGWRIYNIHNNIVDWMTRYEPDEILLHIGTNDISTGADARTAAQRLRRLLDTIFQTDPQVRVYVASIILRTDDPAKAEITEDYAALTPFVVIDQQRRGFDARFVPMHRFIGPDDLEDGLHPNARGYDKMGLVWWAYRQKTPEAALLSMTTPYANHPAELTAQGMEPGAQVNFYATTADLGETEIPDLGVTLDINEPLLLGSATADSEGVATLLVPNVDESLRSRVIRVQAAAQGRKTQALIKIVRPG
ncbi:MAG: hypothetical protein IT430_06970 [Phycisphaerales bacterium]|nr:hypothetical protein [Phycisphaerales bacterium]